MERQMVKSIPQDALFRERIERFMTILAVGPITAITPALEVGDVERFPGHKQAVSYCGLCGPRTARRAGRSERPSPNNATGISSRAAG
jgi:transposase